MESKLKEKAWDKKFEDAIYKEFVKNPFKFDKSSKKPVYSIDTPPPYVNTPIHMGHAATYSLMDMFARFRRMIGFNVLFPLGLDRNGLPIEMAAERKFGKKFNEVSREEFLGMCEKVLEEASTESVFSFQKLAISFNSWKLGAGIGDLYHTDSNDYRALTQETFIDLYKKGLIYEDERVNNYCPGCQTTLADAEVIYDERTTTFNNIIFKVKETGKEFIISTTRPELVCAIGMVIYNPEDDRYKHLEGKTAISPVFNKEVKIMPHPSAEIGKGTGIMMVCSFGDLDDIRFYREMNLTPVITIGSDGKMNEHAGFLKGLTVKEARKKMIDTLKEKGLLVNQKQTSHRTPICERSKDEIEFIAMKEFYLKQVEFKSEMLKIADKINFFAPASKQIYLDWVNSISIDWPISRRRYYATEVPVWHCECGEVILPEKGKYTRPWKDPAPVKECPKCKSRKIKGDERVFDTWFDSSISPLYILKYSRDEEFFRKNTPCSLRPQGKEIIRTWLYYTLFKDYLLTGNPIFKDVWINYHILDERGKKMAKSAGNVIDPQKVIEKYGGEPLRLWCAAEGNLDRTDFRCSEQRIEGAGKTLTKLWNVSRFILMFPEPKGKPKLTALDKFIINEVNSIIKDARKRFEKYDFHNPIINLKNFLWETFASHYVEIVKGRAYNDSNKFPKDEQAAALFTLRHVLEKILKIFAPVIPMITYKIYKEFKNKDIHQEEFPKADEEYKIGFDKAGLIDVNSAVWKAKKDAGKSLKADVSKLTLPEKFKEIEADLKEAHTIKEVCYGKKLEIKL